MGIVYHEKSKIFQIHTRNTTYMMGVYAGVHLQHLYYGRKLTDPNCAYLFPRKELKNLPGVSYISHHKPPVPQAESSAGDVLQEYRGDHLGRNQRSPL